MSSESTESPRPLNPADVLPPVEPPSAGFIVKLFLIPAVIVGVVISILALIYWIRSAGEDVTRYVDALERNDEGRWQAAVNLSNALNKKGNEKYRADPELLKRVTGVFNSELERGSTDDKAIELRYFLTRVLGELNQPEAVTPLVKGLVTKRSAKEVDVRLGAIQGLARLIPNIADAKPQNDKQLTAALVDAAGDESPVVRYHAAYALALLDGTEFVPLLEKLLNDGAFDVRANAAVGLARQGNPACVSELAKMVDPTELDEQLEKVPEKERNFKRTTLLSNGFAAAKMLHQKAPQADVKPIVESLDRLLATNPVTAVKLAAEDVRRELLAPATPIASPTTTGSATATGTAAKP
jgi:HEAT repeat protein